MREQLIEDYFTAATNMQRAWKNYMVSELSTDEISIAQMGLLIFLNDNQPIMGKDVATDMHISRSAVTQLVDGLYDKGLITRTEDPDDRRGTHISLTKSGSAKLRMLNKKRRELFNLLVTDLSEDQITTAIEINTVMLSQIES